MLNIKNGDLLQAFDKGEVNIILHCCNCIHVMGGGIAKVIKNKYPQAYEADLKTPKGDSKLGTLSQAKISDECGVRYIFNLYGQSIPTTEKRAVNYEAIYNSFENVCDIINQQNTINLISEIYEKYVVGIPYKIASDRAGGNWNIISTMIDELFTSNKINYMIYKLQ